MTWLYKGIPFIEPDIKELGFVYLITNTITGRKYIGKKLFWFSKTVKSLREYGLLVI